MSQKIQSLSEYFQEYQESIQQPEEFWSRIAKNFHWKKTWDSVLSWNFEGPEVKWFENAQLNITENIFERQLSTHGEKTAILWEPNDPKEPERSISYNELFQLTCQFSNALESQGIQKGDRVIIYMPMIPEAVIAMLACARIGAIHSVVFGGFASNELASRIDDSKAKLLVTASCGFEPGRTVEYKPLVDEAIKQAKHKISKMILFQRPGQAI